MSPLPLSGNIHLKGDWRCCLEQVTTRVHIDAGCFHPINIHQQRAKANMFPLCDFTIDEPRKTSPSCLSCSTHTDGNGTPKQIMVRKQHTSKLNVVWCDNAALVSDLHCWATCHVFMINPFLALFCRQSPSRQLLDEATLLVSLDYNWLCPGINLPQRNITAWFNMDIPTKPQPGQCVYLSYISWWQHRQW